MFQLAGGIQVHTASPNWPMCFLRRSWTEGFRRCSQCQAVNFHWKTWAPKAKGPSQILPSTCLSRQGNQHFKICWTSDVEIRAASVAFWVSSISLERIQEDFQRAMAGIALEVASSRRPQMDESVDEPGELMTMVESRLTPRGSYFDTEVQKSKWGWVGRKCLICILTHILVCQKRARETNEPSF